MTATRSSQSSVLDADARLNRDTWRSQDLKRVCMSEITRTYLTLAHHAPTAQASIATRPVARYRRDQLARWRTRRPVADEVPRQYILSSMPLLEVVADDKYLCSLFALLVSAMSVGVAKQRYTLLRDSHCKTMNIRVFIDAPKHARRLHSHTTGECRSKLKHKHTTAAVDAHDCV